MQVINRIQRISMEWNGTKESISREFEFENFSAAVAFFNQVAEAAELNDHHPDILLHNYKRVTITLTSHEQGKVTLKDIKLAEIIDEIYTLSMDRS
jgi:4a-hydroxytetrahydrobiopterin dehydratase